MKRYRLFYSLFSFLGFAWILIYSAMFPSQLIIPLSPLTTYFGYLLATFGTIIAIKSSKQIQLKKFLGLSTPESQPSLVTSGLYSRTRHPLYVGLVLIFIGYLFVAGQLTSLIHLLCLLVYLPFGIYYEEKNMLATFGEAYQKYQKEVPVFFPRIFKKKRA
ncbi:putative protein-S-isoprenylcysteine methyltransferase [Algoriphagus machipongonensis]|uniref:Isoprenylcysteine carboxyl methyltransferase family protein n=2 Tax=Algoriphagus machipongonensis TaxID=388413 RepID=A3HUU2_9BACT|nr:putative protein-S-isoprenylcysteine methyltransferase [Algoriphagus machipongonensis]